MPMTREEIDKIIGGQPSAQQMTKEQIDAILGGGNEGAQVSAPSVSNVATDKNTGWSHEAQKKWFESYTGGNAKAESNLSGKARALAEKNGTAYEHEYGNVKRREETRGKSWQARAKESQSVYQPTIEELQMFEGLNQQIAREQEQKKQVTKEDLYTPEAKQLYNAELPQQEQSALIPTLFKPDSEKQHSVLPKLLTESAAQPQGNGLSFIDNLPKASEDFKVFKDTEDMTPDEYKYYALMNSSKEGIPENAPEDVKQAIFDKWIQPDYKLSDTEKKQAKEILKENAMYLEDRAVEKARNQQGLEGQELEDFKAKREALMLLDAKTDVFQQIGAGVFLGAMPMNKKYLAKVNEMTGYDTDYYDNLEQSAKTQNSAAYYGGLAGMELAEYAAGAELMKGLGVTGKIEKGTGKFIKNAKLAEHTANVLGDTALDVALDTVPSLASDISNGESAGTVAKNAAKNVGANLGWNVLGEATGTAVSAIKKGRNVDDILKNPDAFTMETGVRLTGDASQDRKIVSSYLNELANTEIPRLKDNVADEAPTKAEIPDEGNYTLSQIVENVSQKPKNEIIDPVEKAFSEPDVALTHTPEQLKQMKEYYNSADNRIVDFAKKVRNNEYVKPIEVATISDRAAKDIANLTGVSTSGNRIVLDRDSIIHVDSNHGVAGITDHSMADDMTLSRIGYILDNYDSFELGNGTTSKVRLANGDQAPKVVFSKKIDGTYYVVEAVTDAKTKTNRVVTAYIGKTPKKEAYLMPDVSSSPKRYVQDEAEFASSKNNIPNGAKDVNNEMNLSKAGRFSTDTGPVPAVSSDAPKGSDDIISGSAGSVNNPPPRLENKVMAEDIGLKGELPWSTVPNSSMSVAESMGLPDIRKSGQTDTLNIGAEKVSKFRTNTLAKEANFSPEEAAEIYGEDFYKYIPTSEKETFDIAAGRVSDDADGWYKKIMSAEDISDYDNAAGVDTMMQLSTKYRQQARAAKEAGNEELAQTLYAKSRDMTLKLSQMERKAGQELQALKKYAATSDRTLINGEKILQDRVADIAGKNKRLISEVDDIGDAIYRRVHELEQSDLWKQFSSADAMQPATADMREQLRKEVSDIIKQEAGKNKNLAKNLKNSSIDKLADDIIELNHIDRINSALESYATTGVYGISDDVIDQVTDIFAEAEKYHINSKQRVDLESQAYALIAQEVSGSSFHEMFKNWRYLAMLGNTKTHIRNMVSTTGMYATNGVKNNAAAVIEAVVDKTSKATGGKGIERTKAVLNPGKDRGLIKAAQSDADNRMYRELKGNMYMGSVENSIESNKRVFRGKNKVTDTVARAVDKASKLNSAALDAEDYFFVKHKYATSLAGYMKANGLGEEAFEAADELQKIRSSIDDLKSAKQANPFKVVDRAGDAEIAVLDDQIATLRNASGLNPLGQAAYIGEMDTLEKKAQDIARSRIDDQIAALENSAKEYQAAADMLDKGRQYAKKQAEETAFHQDSELVSWLSRFSKGMEEAGKPGKLVYAMVEGIMPFKKTPVNVLKNGMAYSPANILKNLYDIRDVYKGNIPITDYIDSLSKTLTGTGIFAAGCALYDSGVVTAVTDKFGELTGNQNYSIRIGDKTFTLDWAAPDSIPFFAGAAAMEEMAEKGFSLEGVLNALAGMSQPVMEMSMMDGVNTALESIQYMDKDDIFSSAVGTLAGAIGGSYLKQSVPTLLGQAARTVDNTRRSTYTDKEGFAGAADREITKMTNKIPGLSMNNQPYVDAWGREQQNLEGGNLLERAAYQMLSPSYIDNVNVTPVDQEVKRLYDATSDKAVLPTGDTTKKIDDVRMTKEEYTAYSKAAGQARYNLLASCLNNTNYKALDADVQAEVVKDLYGLAKKIGSAEARAGYTSNDSLFKTYREKGLDAAVNYAITKQAEDVAWVPISKTTNSERYENVNSMDMSDEEKGSQLRMSANSSEVADRVYEAFGKSGDAMVYQYYTLDEMAKKDTTNRTEEGEEKTFASSSLGKQYEYITQMSGSMEEKGKMLATVNESNENVQAVANAFGDQAVVAYAQLDALARSDYSNSTEDGQAKSFGSSNITYQYKYVNQVSGISDEAKGTMIYLNQRSSDKVVQVYEEKGGTGVMEYAKIKSNAHTGSGNLKKDELVSYLNRNYFDNATKRYWFNLVGNKKWKCPY